MNDNAFGEEGHTAETTTQEMFDKVSRESYERLDAELDKSLDDGLEQGKLRLYLFNFLYFLVGALLGLLFLRLSERFNLN